MAVRLTKKLLESRIKQIQYYLGPRVGYQTNLFPPHVPEVWLLEYLYILKKAYYKRKKPKPL